MKIENIKSPEDILEYMKENIKYGWLDINNEEHIGNMKNFRRLYRTMTIEETISHGIGTCIEQVNLMSMLLNKLNIPNKMFCTRIYEGDNFNDLEAEEHMHCFVLYYLNNKVYQIEHPNWMRIGILCRSFNRYYGQRRDKDQHESREQISRSELQIGQRRKRRRICRCLSNGTRQLRRFGLLRTPCRRRQLGDIGNKTLESHDEKAGNYRIGGQCLWYSTEQRVIEPILKTKA